MIAPMQIAEIGPRLWRWTALRPDWTPEEGRPGGSDQEVAAFALVEGSTLVLFDPLVPDDEEEERSGATSTRTSSVTARRTS